MAFPALCHIANILNGRNRGITTPRTPSQTRQYIKKPIKPVKSNRADYTKPQIKIKPEILPIIKPIIKTAPVKYTPEVSKSAVTLARSWVPICCILPKKPKPMPLSKPALVIVKPGKFKKARKPRISAIIKPDAEELKLLRINSGYKLRLTWIELAWLKTLAVKRGVDDWLSLVDSKLSYEENKANFVQNFGALNSDNELMQKYKDYQDMARDEYRNA